MALTATVTTQTAGSSEILPGSIVFFKGSVTDNVYGQKYCSFDWALDLPGDQTWTETLDWLVPLVAGTTISATKNMATEFSGYNMPVQALEAGTLGATLTVIDGDGTSATSTEATVTVLGMDAYDRVIYFDSNATAAGGVFFDDTFTDTATTVIASHTPDLSLVGWVWSTGGGTLEINGAGTGLVCSARNGAGFGSAKVDTGLTNCAVEAVVSFSGTGNNTAGVYGRANQASATVPYQNSFILTLNRGTGELLLGKRVSGTPTTLDSTTISVSNGTPYTLRLVCNGTAIEGWLNGVLTLSATDSDLSTNTAFGVFGVQPDIAGATWDDFQIETIGIGAGTDPVTDPLNSMTLMQTILNQANTKLLIYILPGTHTPTTTWLPEGDNIWIRAYDLADPPVFDAVNAGTLFRIQGPSNRVTIQGIYGINTSASVAATFASVVTSTSAVDCAVIDCDHESISASAGLGFDAGYNTTTDGSRLHFMRCWHSKPTINNYATGAFGESDFCIINCKAGNSTLERGTRVSGNALSEFVMWGCDYTQQSSTGKNPLRIQDPLRASVVLSSLVGDWTSVGGGDIVHPDNIRIERCRIQGIQNAVSDINPEYYPPYVTACVVDDLNTRAWDATPFPGDIGFTPAENGSIVRHCSIFVQGNFLTRTGNTVMGGVGWDTYGTVMALDGSAVAAANGQPNDTTGVYAQNIWPPATKTTASPSLAMRFNGANRSEAEYLALPGVTGDEFTDVSFDTNWVPSVEKTVTVQVGTHRDFFGRAVTPGDSVWAGAVMMALTAPSGPTLLVTTPAEGVIPDPVSLSTTLGVPRIYRIRLFADGGAINGILLAGSGVAHPIGLIPLSIPANQARMVDIELRAGTEGEDQAGQVTITWTGGGPIDVNFLLTVGAHVAIPPRSRTRERVR